MKNALAFVAPAIGAKKLSRFLVIRGHTVTAFNGEQVLRHPFPTDLEFAPKAKAFCRAIKRCKETIALWVNPEGNVMVHSGDHTETIECEPLTSFPPMIQTGFWFDVPKPKKPTVPKCVPPEPVWLSPDYLPYLEEARGFRPSLFTKEELIAAAMAKEQLLCDCEVYPNYFLLAFTSFKSGKVIYFEMFEGSQTDIELAKWVVDHFTLVTFYGNNFDILIVSLFLAGKTCAQLKQAADKIIIEEIKPWLVLRSFKVKRVACDHIDLYEVCPLDGSLKLYGGRLHSPRIMDLPFKPETMLSDDQICIVRFYCISSDLTATGFCFKGLQEQIQIRQAMSERYGLDLRSKSDAQIAGAVINGELKRLSYGLEPERNEVEPGTRYKYNTPSFVSFRSPLLQWALALIQSWDFVVNANGYVEIPIDPATGKTYDLQLKIGKATYMFGMGGLHSNETTVTHRSDENFVLLDRDVASYYPQIILNLELYPLHLGPAFLQVYRSIVQDRLAAKAAKDKIKAELLKIVVNGTFGHTSNKWSTMYSPDLTMTITVTGQLCLLMLIERLELAGIEVCSANTDGIVSKVPRRTKQTFDDIFNEWEKETGFKTEETEYRSIHSRDVNNYIAVKSDLKTKMKGAYLNPWALQNPGDAYDRFKKNPHGTISIEAVTEFLTKGTPIAQTVRSATDIRKFVAIRTVKGGGVKDGVYLGKAVRWYYQKGQTGWIVYAKTGNKVANTDGACPCMLLPKTLPADIDFEYYETKAFEILREIGCLI